MKIWDYLVIDHIAKRHSYYNARRQLEKEKETIRNLSFMFTSAPIATLFFFISFILLMFFYKHLFLRWTFGFIFLECSSTILAAQTRMPNQKIRYTIVTAASLLSFVAWYSLLSHQVIWLFALLIITAFFLIAFFGCYYQNSAESPFYIPPENYPPTDFSSPDSAILEDPESTDCTRSESPENLVDWDS